MSEKPLYSPFVSTAKNKKYSVYVVKDGRKRLIHFGDSRYGQYHDKLGNYTHLDHNDPERKRLYYARHGPTLSQVKLSYRYRFNTDEFGDGPI